MHFVKLANMAKNGLKALNTAKKANNATGGGEFPIFKGAAIGCGAISLFLTLAIVVIIAYVILGPIIGIIVIVDALTSKITTFGEKAWNWVTSGCYDTDSVCENKAQEKFYNELEEVYEDYEKKYIVKINTGLISATLLYNAEDLDERFEELEKNSDEEIADPNSGVKWSKLSKKIDDLAKEQISKRVNLYCDDELHDTVEGLGVNEKVPSWSCDSGETKDEKTVYYIDYERYENFLKDGYVENNILKNKDIDDLETKVDVVTKEIFSISNTAHYLIYGSEYGYSGGGYYDSACDYNLTKVEVIAHDGRLITTLSMEDYIIGVTYAEVGYFPTNIEYMKTQMVAAKTYALVRGKYDSATKKITIKASTSDQAWCDVYNGCMIYYNGFAGETQLQWFYPKSSMFNYPGAMPYKTNLSQAQIKEMKSIYKEVEGYLYAPNSLRGPVTSHTDLTSTGYVSSIQNQWNAWGQSGNSFKEILDLTATIRDEYKDHYLYSLGDYCNYNTISGNCTTSVPIKISVGEEYNISSGFGMRVHPITGEYKLHNGIDLSYGAGTPIYNIYDGTVISTTVETTSCGLGASIGHDIDGDGKYDYKSSYCHMISGSLSVSTGDFVTGGTQIGMVGNTGGSTGNHLHFAIYDFSLAKHIDSKPILDSLVTKTSVFDNAACSVSDVTKLSQFYQNNYSNIELCETATGDSRTVSTSGCLISAYAAAYYTATGNVPDMKTLASDISNIGGYICNEGGSAPTLFQSAEMTSKYGLSGTAMGTSVTFDDVATKLKAGYKLIVSIKNGSRNVGEGGFNASDGSHFVMLDHVDPAGRIYLFNPSRGTNEGYKTKDEIEKFVLSKIYSGMWYIEKTN